MHCPVCGNDETRTTGSGATPGGSYRHIECYTCGAEWTEQYTLTARTDVTIDGQPWDGDREGPLMRRIEQALVEGAPAISPSRCRGLLEETLRLWKARNVPPVDLPVAATEPGDLTGMPVEQETVDEPYTFTAFCRRKDGTGQTWIDTITGTRDDISDHDDVIGWAITVATLKFARAWGCQYNQVECVGLIRGRVDIAMWNGVTA